MSRVAIVKGKRPVEMTVEALEMVSSDVDLVIKGREQILIKPNHINAARPSTGVTTDSRIVEGVVKFLTQREKLELVIGEGSGFADTFHAFEVAGVTSVAKRWGVKLLDLNVDEFIDVPLPGSKGPKKIKVAKTCLESVVVSIPKLKLHRMAVVSLSLKNMMGALASKGSMHRGRLSKNIVALASVLCPDIAVIDGIVGGEGHEICGSPVEMNLVVAGTDPVAVDSVGAAIMGVSPKDVKHLVYAEQRGLGISDLRKIEVLGVPIEAVKRKFNKAFTSKILSRFG